MFPGVCAEGAAIPVRVFLGTQPSLKVGQLLTRSMQPVYPWYVSRKRVKEQVNDFMELDGSSIDTDIMLQYAHVHYVRRHVVETLIEKQLSILDAGKPAKQADPVVTACLSELVSQSTGTVEQEFAVLGQTKATLGGPGRRELDPAGPMDRGDILCMMRCFEEDALGENMKDLESRCKPFFPVKRVQEYAMKLVSVFGEGTFKLDKKDEKLLRKLIPSDYDKVGATDKLRPVDAIAYYRFIGEHAVAPQGSTFTKQLWGNVFRKIASHPKYMSSISQYWSITTGLDLNPPESQLPVEYCTAACAGLNRFPAIAFRTLESYSSETIARQRWSQDPYFVPCGRLFHMIGKSASEEALANVLVDGYWHRLGVSPSDNVLEERFVRSLRTFVEETSAMYGSNVDGLMGRVADSFKDAVPTLAAPEVDSTKPTE